jgi:hypothetical protein
MRADLLEAQATVEWVSNQILPDTIQRRCDQAIFLANACRATGVRRVHSMGNIVR